MRRSTLDALMQLPFLIAVYDGPDHLLTLANPAYRSLMDDAYPEKQPVRELFGSPRGDLTWLHSLDELNQVYSTGCALHRTERRCAVVRAGSLKGRFFNVSLLPEVDIDGAVVAVVVAAAEVTEEVASRQDAQIAAAAATTALERERKRLETVLRSQQVLVEAGTLLASSLDYEATLHRIAQLAVPALADFCLIHMVEDGQLRRVAQAFSAASDLAEHRWLSNIDDLHDANPIAVVLRTGRPALIRHATDDILLASAFDEPHLAAMRAISPRSVICVPLTVRGQTRGTMMFATTRTERLYDESSVTVAEQLGQRAAWAVDSALLYKAAEEARARSEEARRDAENANQLKDNFLATVSHELRTPMAALLLWENILRAASDEPMRLRALDAIHQSAAAQSKLIEDLMDVSRCISGKLRIDLRPVEIVPVLEAAIEVALPVANAKGVRMDAFLDHTLGQVMGDPDRLKQIVGNLLANAIKFTDSDGRITIRAERRREQVEIMVMDTGRGIPADFLPEIFKPFTQADGSVTRNQGGMGLGLAIVWQLVDLHGGVVRAESAGPRRGTSMIVMLPLHHARGKTPAHGETADAPDGQYAAEKTPAIIESPPLQGLRVLVVDDEPRVREALTVLLRQAGASVKAVPSAEMAVTTLGQARWDVLVSDIGMPGEDGFSFMKRLRALPDEQGGDVPAIALTAYARAEDQARAADVGFDLHLAKPVEAEVLIHALSTLIGKRHRTQHRPARPSAPSRGR